ncbi:MAG TPA: NAD(P)-dependent oxidoreductase, partial [Xanthobacteraceae bacterium]|nr:NAD(P)-dependent oxidoreductase [Xanthobacteraceae bacterium]
KELAEKSDVIFLCVTGAAEVEALMRGKEGVAAGAKKGAIVIDTSTSEPTLTRALAEELAARGIVFCDAPLARTPKEAEEGKLGVMMGGDAATFETVKPILSCFADTINHVGPVGAGHAIKLINNFVAMGYGAIYAEALALGRKAGIEPKTFDKVIRGGRMDCGFYQTFMGYALEGNRESHKFALRNAHKDMRYVANLGNASGIANSLAAAVKNSYAAAESMGYGGENVPLLTDAIAQLNGLSPLHAAKRSAAE